MLGASSVVPEVGDVNYGHPGFISEPPIEGLSIVEAGGWCQEPAPFPVLVASRPPTPCEDYNYKSSPKVTGCRSGGPANWQSDPHRPAQANQVFP